jgi:N-methylhydantoinase A
MAAQLRIAADIGGTFTDIVLALEGGVVATRKVASTPQDYAQGVLRGICELMQLHGLALGDISEVLHGCTIATNAIVEGKGARIGLITTRGFRDVLELRRIRVPKLYDPLYVKPEPLVPRDRRLELTERLGPDGSVLVPLDEDDAQRCMDRLHRLGVEAVAVCLLHAYANPAHERRLGEMLRACMPEVFVTLSSDILPEIREYERTSTAVINSYVGPVVASYINALAQALRAAGITGPLLVMQSSGGILEASRVAETPARIVECGPAAGVIGAARQARLAGISNVITLDMGGTTAKASLVEDGNISRTDEYEVGGGISLSSRLVKGGGYALKLPVIDISEVGAGGGSIVWFDKAGGLKVGPHSAGAMPGPACYGTGGTHATVTDANLLLGFINPHALAGGSMPIRAELSREAMADQVMAQLGGGDLLEAAWAVHVVAAANMMRAVKAVSTYRGRDPADFVLMAFGGNGGIFAAELARQLQMRRVLVPPGAGVFSAIGLTMADKEFGRTHVFISRVDRMDTSAFNRTLRTLEREVTTTLGESAGAVTIRRNASMRYAGQAFELPVQLPAHDLAPGDRLALADAFEAEHERSYGHRLPDAPGVDTVALEVVAATQPWSGFAPLRLAAAGAPSAASERLAYFGPELGARRTVVLPRREMLAGAPREGPLIIEEYEGTTVVPPGCLAWLDTHANIVIAFAEEMP